MTVEREVMIKYQLMNILGTMSAQIATLKFPQKSVDQYFAASFVLLMMIHFEIEILRFDWKSDSFVSHHWLEMKMK